ncbi:hypothetical protein BOTBODRAFT_144484 [Botryobasidium botryosum FD-172 SS1]|uniref:DUF3533 domain-containing protein n=1 Tax=Botryobasidium botryosum (strain FD-172 SS1) TaxID=930990 RepID=A0A067MMH1_BOTB1|nr:hypothetical protein BOTBODRAFT_144484 [Botryobasidium botryosum FD-172 SS1]
MDKQTPENINMEKLTTEMIDKPASLHSPTSGVIHIRRRSASFEDQVDAYVEDDNQSVDSVEEKPEEPKLKKHAYHFFSPEIAHLRRAYIKPLLMVITLIVITQWGFIPLFFGSLWHNPTFTPNLRAFLIDRDGSDLGSTMVSAFMENISGANGVGKHHLGWRVINASTYATNEEVAKAIVEEKAWLAVVVGEGATAKLISARQNGDASYDPQAAVTVYYNQARNEQAAGNYIVPLTTALLNQTLTLYSQRTTAAYFAQAATNATAMNLLAVAPQTVVTPVSYTMINLRPYSTPIAIAVTVVGQIFLIIFAFIVTMANFGLRAQIAPYLTMRSYLLLRCVVPIIAYIPVSFSYTMIDLPFHIPFASKYSYAGGYFVLWIYMWMGMTSLGLATEAMITVLGLHFMPFFLLPLIISNVSVAMVPIDLQPWIYRYGYGFPIYNLGTTIRTIIFNTHSQMGRNAGVVLAWIVLSCFTITTLTYWFESRARAAAAKAEAESKPTSA